VIVAEEIKLNYETAVSESALGYLGISDKTDIIILVCGGLTDAYSDV
jgi:hypothetical protein